MATSLYDFSIPALTRGLTNLSAILDKPRPMRRQKKLTRLCLRRRACSRICIP